MTVEFTTGVPGAGPLPLREFDLLTFHRFTPELTGEERAAVFFALPAEMQDQAWRELDGRIRARGDALFEEARDEC